VQFGSLPRLYLEKKRREDALFSYVETYLKEEIQQEALTRNVPAFYRFLEVAAQQNSNTINYSSIAAQVGVSDNTVKQYFEILSDTLIGTIFPAFDHSVRKQLVKANKFYFFDSGVLNAITGDLKTELLRSSYRFGRLFETFIINEVVRLNEYLGFKYKLSYWRTLNGQEVDLIISKKISEGPTFAIEIKSSESPNTTDISSLKAIKEEFPNVSTFCFCNTPVPYNLEGIEVLPWQKGLERIL